MKYNILLGAAAAVLLLASCDTEMIPKGQTTLKTASDLELLMNRPLIQNKPFQDISIIVNESYGDDYAATVAAKIKQGNTLNSAYLGYNESIDRAKLSAVDYRYNYIYKYINGLNVIINKIDDSEGDATQKRRIKAEACVQRGYYHFLAAGIYARQYDEATAASNGGIAYVDDINNEQTKVQLSLDKVYSRILGDMSDENIEALPDKNNSVRFSRATGYAAKSRVLFQMKRYPEALKYALKALEMNSTIEDRRPVIESGSWVLPATAENNFVYISPQGNATAIPLYEEITLETVELFEEGDIVLNYAKQGRFPVWNGTYGKGDTGIDGCLEFYSRNQYVNPWGLTVERTMYNAAECYIRTGHIDDGLDLVNDVRRCRIAPDKFTEFSADNEEDAMALLQRAKFIENIGSYENYFDRKRWNTEEKYKKTISRTVPDAGTFSISPESPLWVQPFSVEVMSHNPSFRQNY